MKSLDSLKENFGFLTPTLIKPDFKTLKNRDGGNEAMFYLLSQPFCGWKRFQTI